MTLLSLTPCCAAQALPNQADWSMESGCVSRQEQLAKQAGKTMGEGGDVDGLGGQPHHHVSPNILDHQDLNIPLHHTTHAGRYRWLRSREGNSWHLVQLVAQMS